MCKGISINTFTINNQTFSIRLSEHAILRMEQRHIDQFQMIGAILSLGEKKILEYKDAQKDVMILDKHNNFAIVFCVEHNHIMVITLIDKCDCWSRIGTTVINI